MARSERYKIPAKEVGALVSSLANLVNSTTAESLADNSTPGSLEKLSFELAAAKRGIARLISNGAYLEFTDNASQVSLRELLALVAKIIEDESSWLPRVARTDVIKAVVSSFYQIQRGYNINEEDIDDGEEMDQSICISGTFNQALDPFQSIHPDVIIQMVTQKTAVLRFQIIVKECLVKHLKASPISAIEMEKLLKVGVGDHIKDISQPVKEKMAAEFPDFYEILKAHADGTPNETLEARALDELLVGVGPYMMIKSEELIQAGIQIRAIDESAAGPAIYCSFFGAVPTDKEPDTRVDSNPSFSG